MCKYWNLFAFTRINETEILQVPYKTCGIEWWYDGGLSACVFLYMNINYTQTKSKRNNVRLFDPFCVLLFRSVPFYSILFSIQFVFGSNSLNIHTFDPCTSMLVFVCVWLCILKCRNGTSIHFTATIETLNRNLFFFFLLHLLRLLNRRAHIPFRLNHAIHNLHAYPFDAGTVR